MKKISLAFLTVLGIVACTPEQKKESAGKLIERRLVAFSETSDQLNIAVIGSTVKQIFFEHHNTSPRL